MKKQFLTIKGAIIIFAFFFTGCASTTMIQSNPNGAKVYLNGEEVGMTPYTHRDTKIVGSTTAVRLEKDGYQTLNTSFSRNEEVDVGAVIGGCIVWVPFLWTMKYKPIHSYELVPMAIDQVPINNTQQQQQQGNQKSKADRLRELKQLLDDKILTEEEYEKEKKKILEEDNN